MEAIGSDRLMEKNEFDKLIVGSNLNGGVVIRLLPDIEVDMTRDEARWLAQRLVEHADEVTD